MPKEDAKAEPIEVKTGNSRSVEELEAEIAATAAALSAPSGLVGNTANASSEEEVLDEELATQESAQDSDPAASPGEDSVIVKEAADTDSEGESVVVEVKKRSLLEDDSTNDKGGDETDAETIEEDTPSGAARSSTKASAISSKGKKVIAPISTDNSKKPGMDVTPPTKTVSKGLTIAEVAKQSSGESADAEADETTKDTPEASPVGGSSSEEAAHKLDALSGELREREEVKKDLEDQQEMKVFDTKKYHLPIKASHHHRKASLPAWARLFVLLSAVVGSLLYAVNIGIINVDEWFERTVQPVEVAEEAAGTRQTGSLFGFFDESFARADVRSSFLFDGVRVPHSGVVQRTNSGEHYLVVAASTTSATNDVMRATKDKQTVTIKGRLNELLSTQAMSVNLADVLGFTRVISDTNPFNRYSLAANDDRTMTELDKTACEGLRRAALQSISGDVLVLSSIDKVEETDQEVVFGASRVTETSFGIGGTVLTDAYNSVLQAVEQCIPSDLPERAEALAQLIDPASVKVAVIDTAARKRVSLQRVAAENTIILAEMEFTNIKTDAQSLSLKATPKPLNSYEIVMAFAVSACKDSDIAQVYAKDSGYELQFHDTNTAFSFPGSRTLTYLCRSSLSGVSNNNIFSALSDADLLKKGVSLFNYSQSFAIGQSTIPTRQELLQDNPFVIVRSALDSDQISYKLLPESCTVSCDGFLIEIDFDTADSWRLVGL